MQKTYHMILPIVAYGAVILRTPCLPVTPDTPGLQQLITNMWHTLDNANGVGLAAPQVNHPYQLFIVDNLKTTTPDDLSGIRQVFINATVLEYSIEQCTDTEGCLSIPGIWEEVSSAEWITLQYQDASFVTHTRTFTGSTARMIQHEYDHVQGKLYLDYLSPLRKALLKNKLQAISKGKATARYPMVIQRSR